MYFVAHVVPFIAYLKPTKPSLVFRTARATAFLCRDCVIGWIAKRLRYIRAAMQRAVAAT
jgi:hypothetical protein